MRARIPTDTDVLVNVGPENLCSDALRQLGGGVGLLNSYCFLSQKRNVGGWSDALFTLISHARSSRTVKHLNAPRGASSFYTCSLPIRITLLGGSREIFQKCK